MISHWKSFAVHSSIIIEVLIEVLGGMWERSKKRIWTYGGIMVIAQLCQISLQAPYGAENTEVNSIPKPNLPT